MKLSLIIALSLSANIILAGWWLKAHHETALQTEPMETDSPALNKTAARQTSGAVETSSAQLSWLDLQTEDLKEFIARLRAVDCPEGTIEDLVLAEVNRRFGIKMRELWPQNNNPWGDYWKPYKLNNNPAEVKKNRDRMHQQQSLQKEKSALLVDLFGVDIEKQRLKEEGINPDNMGWNPYGNLSFLPEDKRAAAQKILDDFQDKEQEFYASVSGNWDADARTRQKKLEQEKFAALAEILTPDELREYKLRNSQIANQIMSELRGVDLTRQQYEALYDIREKYGDSIYNYSNDGNTPDQIKQIEQNKKDMQAEIANALGADKQAELERANDYNYQQLASLAKRNNLPADTAGKIYDFKSAAEKAAQELRVNTDLTSDERQAALAQIRTETEQAVKTAFGSDKIYNRYVNSSGWWLNNIAPAQHH